MKKIFMLLLLVIVVSGCKRITITTTSKKEITTKTLTDTKKTTKIFITPSLVKMDVIKEVDKLEYLEILENKVYDINVKDNDKGTYKLQSNKGFYGNVNYIDVYPNEGYKLAFIKTGNKLLSLENRYVFYITDNIDLEIEYIDDNKFFLLILDAQNDILYFDKTDFGGSFNEIDNLIERYGYKVNFDHEKLKNVKEDQIIYLDYELEDFNYNLNVQNGNVTLYGNVATFTKDIKDNFFVGWYLNNELVSLDGIYSRTVNSDITLEARFLDIPFLNKPIVNLYDYVEVYKEQIVFTGQINYSLSNLLLVEFGILKKENFDDFFSDAVHLNTIYMNSSNEFRLAFDKEEGLYQAYAVYRNSLENMYIYQIYFSNIFMFKK